MFELAVPWRRSSFALPETYSLNGVPARLAVLRSLSSSEVAHGLLLEPRSPLARERARHRLGQSPFQHFA
jgi:hypothetical protein